MNKKKVTSVRVDQESQFIAVTLNRDFSSINGCDRIPEICRLFVFLRSLACNYVSARMPGAWFAFKIGPATFGIFDSLRDEEGRSAHINGEVAKALFARAEELFVTHPQIQTAEIVAEKV